MTTTGKLCGLSMSLEGSQIVSVAIDSDFREEYDELKDCVVSMDIKKFRNRRSLEANRYAWQLIGQIARKKQEMEPKGGWTPEKVYKKAIMDAGAVYITTGMKNIAIERFKERWTSGHIGRWVEVLDGSSREGWSNVRIYYGSSDYDTAEMSLFINSIIQDAEALGIPTITEKKAKEMIGYWKKGEENDGNRSQGTENNPETGHTEVPA